MEHSALCVGQVAVDLVGAVPRFPTRTGDQHELSAYTLQGGGAAANVAVALARLGVKVRFAGVLPDDFMGEFAAASLSEEKVDLSHLRRQAGGATPVEVVLLDEEKGRRTVFFTKGECEVLKPGELSPAALEGVELVYLDGSFPEAQLELATAAKKAGVRTMLGVRKSARGLMQLVSTCDLVVASEEFARELSPVLTRSVTELLALGAQVAVVTMGRDGCVGQEKGKEPVRLPAQEVAGVDSTGAGDAFRGAFAVAVLEGLPLVDQLKWGSMAAALKCQSFGARAGMPDLTTLRAALR